ncbi:exonuclease domain-containing protein [Streptacidiphilus monticola]|uniref:Exonuclease domain-containing protein n=1 Tax=Streptacidiphilus monticola TaxID=2161674 RepID=A0ABW1G476_9ACTN
MSWVHETLVGFDLETTGTDPGEARIVTAALVEVKGGDVLKRTRWLADPGVEIPAEATAVHGITTARAVAEGRPAAEVVEEVAAALAEHWRQGVPIVVYNAPFDLSLIGAELTRHQLPSLSERLGGVPIGPVIDPLTVDRALDRYRRGSRSLQNACLVYGVTLEDAHEACADALAAVRVAIALGRKYRAEAGSLTLDLLHAQQAEWHAAWALDFQAWLRRDKDPAARVDSSWPLRTP